MTWPEAISHIFDTVAFMIFLIAMLLLFTSSKDEE